MRSAEEWADEIRRVRSEALAEGERLGRIEGLREAAIEGHKRFEDPNWNACYRNAADVIRDSINEQADRLEREG